jgi:type II secretory pathway pseudopilin PulG
MSSKKQNLLVLSGRSAMTLVEILVSMAILSALITALVPQFRAIQSSWAANQSRCEVVQNGRVFMDHFAMNLAKAFQISSVSASSVTNGFIQFINADGNSMQYDIDSSGYVEYGDANSRTFSRLASNCTQLQFTCYDAYNLDTAITDGNSIRCVYVQATFNDAHNTSVSRSFSGRVYLRSNNLPVQGNATAPVIFDYDDGKAPAVIQVDARHYLTAYSDYWGSGYAQVITVDPTANTVTPATPFNFDTTASDPSLEKIDGSHFLCAYKGLLNEGYSVIFTVNTSNWSISKSLSYVFDSGSTDQSSVCQIDGSHYLCAYKGTSSYGWAVILNVNAGAGTISKGTALKYDSYKGYNPSLSKIDGSHFLCAYRGRYDYGYAAILSTNIGAGTITKGASCTFDSARCDWPSLSAMDGSTYVCTYAGYNYHGTALLLTIGSGQSSVTAGPAFVFDSSNGKYSSLAKVTASSYLCAYQTASSRGWAKLLNANKSSGNINLQGTIVFDGSKCLYPALAQVSSNQYLCLYQATSDYGKATILSTNFPVLP